MLEHLLISQLLRFAWLRDEARLEVMKPEIDRSGYDIVLEVHGVCRHVPLKTSSHSAKTSRQNIHVDLASKPSGCVIWTRFKAERPSIRVLTKGKFTELASIEELYEILFGVVV